MLARTAALLCSLLLTLPAPARAADDADCGVSSPCEFNGTDYIGEAGRSTLLAFYAAFDTPALVAFGVETGGTHYSSGFFWDASLWYKPALFQDKDSVTLGTMLDPQTLDAADPTWGNFGFAWRVGGGLLLHSKSLDVTPITIERSVGSASSVSYTVHEKYFNMRQPVYRAIGVGLDLAYEPTGEWRDNPCSTTGATECGQVLVAANRLYFMPKVRLTKEFNSKVQRGSERYEQGVDLSALELAAIASPDFEQLGGELDLTLTQWAFAFKVGLGALHRGDAPPQSLNNPDGTAWNIRLKFGFGLMFDL